MNKKRTSLKALILVPVFILGILSVLSNVMAVNNIRKVNRNASRIADDCMNSISELSAIENETQSIAGFVPYYSNGPQYNDFHC